MSESSAKNLADRLRTAIDSVRRKSYPLSDLIPLLQQTVDHLEGRLETKDAVIAGWYAALDCHSKYGMSGWSSHRMAYLKQTIETLSKPKGQPDGQEQKG